MQFNAENFNALLSSDLDAIPDFDDKFEECKYFYSLAKDECDIKKFRWLVSACLNSANSFFDIKAGQLYHAFEDAETGEAIKDEEKLELFKAHMKTKQSPKNPSRIKAFPIGQLLERMREIRNANAHEHALFFTTRESGNQSAYEITMGQYSVSALQFCEHLIQRMEEVIRELS